MHSYGFNLPAAGKTGTSHDAWFAGFTTKLLCIVWVGPDDYQDLKVEGAHAALPVWAEFMKKAAHKHRMYRDVADFKIPEGVVSAQIDPESGQLATSACPKAQNGVLPGWHATGFVLPLAPGWIHPDCRMGCSGALRSRDAPPIPTQPTSNLPPPPGSPQVAQDQSPQQEQKPKKSGFFDKLKSIFK